MTPPTDLLSGIAICVAAAALLALVGWRLRQPLILAYLLAGVVIGPIGFRWVTDLTSIQTVAEIGLILLLFVIGLEIDLKKLAAAGPPMLLTGALQVPICIALGLGFFALLGAHVGGGDYSLLYLAACMSLSSTLVVVKLLNARMELDTLPGRITLGVLVIQDLWAVAMLAVQPNISNPDLLPLAFSLWRGALLVVGGLALSKYVLPYLFRSVAKAPELVLVTALAWCFFLAGVASFIGLSREMGALIAGVSLSTFPYNLDVMAKATSIRDFFVTLFFVALGMQIPVPSLRVLALVGAASLFVILSRAVVIPILYALRLGLRNSIVPVAGPGAAGDLEGVVVGQRRVSVLVRVVGGHAGHARAAADAEQDRAVVAGREVRLDHGAVAGRIARGDLRGHVGRLHLHDQLEPRDPVAADRAAQDGGVEGPGRIGGCGGREPRARVSRGLSGLFPRRELDPL